VFAFPITQVVLADCLGLSTVHVNRVLQDLRKQGVLTVNRADFRLVRQRELEEIAGFEPLYLHLNPNG
jgi:DNA-binding transcriptional regulator LsrR (DeoR family)